MRRGAGRARAAAVRVVSPPYRRRDAGRGGSTPPAAIRRSRLDTRRPGCASPALPQSPPRRRRSGRRLPSLRDAILRDIQRGRAALGLPPLSLDDAAAPADGEHAAVTLLEHRISNARLTPEQKRLLRQFTALWLHEAKGPKDLPKVARATALLVGAWESLNRGREVAREDPTSVKRIADHLRELAARDAAAGGALGDSAARAASGGDAPAAVGRVNVVA